ncbi:hypothetical protein EOW65_16110 [Sinirhodobacter ferrireducens]|uniref:Uncharacterized protein n=1 Tax=Paenirhodobacter ferrireducens TaxID=1215032 RepID=A0A443L8G4_9RHOB|nr:hypothetical protein [Sinirhodobacter ferrireducens]RWR45363.1 hypothetical protein EOW65_16110 [Sinirhodobacter ferrireducens]
MINRRMIPFLALAVSAWVTGAASASVKDYRTCLQAYVNVTGYLQFAEPRGMQAKRVAFDVDFERFVQMGIDRYGEDRLRQMIPEPEDSFIKAMVPLHSTDGELLPIPWTVSGMI